jgi:Signal transduction histidine kinase
MSDDCLCPATAGATETEQLRVELAIAKRRLAEAYQMVSLGRLVAGIIHEINTPIGSILSNNQVILRSLEQLKTALSAGEPPNAKVFEILETMASLAAVDKLACERISGVIRSLKTFARVDQSDVRKANVHELLTNTLKLTSCEFRRRIVVETDFGDIPEIECYPQLLSQVFLNLLVNAGQAIEGEGRITVRTRRDGESIVVSISDTGRGIPQEYRQKIFAPGFSTKPVGVGTGLGLALSREIVVDNHGGEISFESEVGAGTTFHVRLPLKADRSKLTAAEPAGR